MFDVRPLLRESLNKPLTVTGTGTRCNSRTEHGRLVIYIYIRLFHHEGSTKSITDKNIKMTGQGQEVCTRT